MITDRINQDEIELVEDFTRNIRTIGHFGTGDIEIRITSMSTSTGPKT